MNIVAILFFTWCVIRFDQDRKGVVNSHHHPMVAPNDQH
jgi:hypothetical protein